MPFWNVTPSHLHTEHSLYDCRKVQRSKIFKQNLIISIQVLLHFYCFEPPSSWGWGQGVRGYLGAWGCPHTHAHMHAHTCKEIANGCNMLIMLCLWSPHGPSCPHIIPVIPMLSPHCLEGPYIILNSPDS